MLVLFLARLSSLGIVAAFVVAPSSAANPVRFSQSLVTPGRHPASVLPRAARGVRPDQVSDCTGIGSNSFVGNGNSNVAAGLNSGVLDGEFNQACNTDSGVGSGNNNIVFGTNIEQSFVGGGASNLISNSLAFIGAGDLNTNSGLASSIDGGTRNFLSGTDSAIGAGYSNNVSADYSVAGGGYSNGISSNFGFIGAGEINTITASGQFQGAYYSAIGGGYGNEIQALSSNGAQYGFIGGGDHNKLTGLDAAIGGGSMNSATGEYATVPGGVQNVAHGIASVAAGTKSQALNDGTFVWSDHAGSATTLKSTGANQFLARASGGVKFYSNAALTSGVLLAAGSGTWASLSDRAVKAGVTRVDDARILQKVAALPVTEWSYATENGVRHVGPMAQDFYAAFHVGEDERHITSIDEDGVALAAIKGLYASQQRENAALRSEIATLRSEIDTLALQQSRRAATTAPR